MVVLEDVRTGLALARDGPYELKYFPRVSRTVSVRELIRKGVIVICLVDTHCLLDGLSQRVNELKGCCRDPWFVLLRLTEALFRSSVYGRLQVVPCIRFTGALINSFC